MPWAYAVLPDSPGGYTLLFWYYPTMGMLYMKNKEVKEIKVKSGSV
jgi:hypothetical protein